jgi:hypothetical protein
MPKTAISVTLDQANLLWLRSQTAAAKRRSVSETLDRIVTDARQGGRGTALAIRSVVGTIDVTADDPDLAQADAYVRELVGRSTRRPFVVKEASPRYGARRRTRRG